MRKKETLMSLTSMYLRYKYGKGDRQRDAGLSTPDDVVRYDDIQYGKDPKWQVLDVYRPKGVEGKLPVIISVHGGAWVYGSKEIYQFYGMSLAQRGFAMINFSYRLAPEARYPAQLEDTNAVVKWMFEHQDEYGFDTDNVFAVGDSAGGHLLSVYAAMSNDGKLAEYYHIAVPEDFNFRAIALNCGLYRYEREDMDKGTVLLMNDILGKNWSDKDLAMFNSYDKIKEGYPAVFLMTSNGDFLKDQPEQIIPYLKENNVPYELHVYGNDDNILYHVFHVNMKLEEAKICNDEECEFFRKHLK